MKICQSTFKPSTIQAGFSKQEVYLVNTDLVIQEIKKCVPEPPILQIYDRDSPQSSPSQLLSMQSPLKTVQQLYSNISKIQDSLADIQDELAELSLALDCQL